MRILPLLLACACTWTPLSARAALVGNIFSGPTTDDAASIYWNPGAMTMREGTYGILFGALSAIRLHYQRDLPSGWVPDGTPGANSYAFPQADVFVPKPNLIFGVVTDATLKKFRFGVAVTLPIIEGASWENEYGGLPSSTRYYAERARMMILKISPAAAYKINRYVSVGVGLDVVGLVLTHQVMTDFGAKVNQMACAMNPSAPCLMDAPLPREDPAFQGPTSIDGMGWGVGVVAGVLVTPLKWLRLGAGFHSGAGTIDVPVDLSVEVPASVTTFLANNFPTVAAKLPPLNAEGTVEVTSPMIATAGIAVSPLKSNKLELAFDMHYIDFSSTAVMIGNVTRKDPFELIGDQVLIKARTDSFLLGLRGSYQLLKVLAAALRFEYETNTRPDQWVSPVSIDFHRFSLHAGVRWQATRWLALSLEYGHYWFPDRNISSDPYESRFAPAADPVTPEEQGFDKPPPTGRYWVETDRVGLGVMLSF
jgi:long-subunit fatty acid transport protein